MKYRRTVTVTMLIGLVMAAGIAAQPFPMMDQIANRIIQKYQTLSCDQLWQEKVGTQGQPKSPEEQKALNMLRTDPQMRAAFIDKIAAPVATKLFDCGMIP